jgi:putative membrane protein
LPDVSKTTTQESRVRDHLANERTYLAWIRTGIAVIGLGFVVAKFGLIVKELVPLASTASLGFSSVVGVALVLAGALMQLFALRRFARNQVRIATGTYEPSKRTETTISYGVFLVAVLLIVYLIVTT